MALTYDIEIRYLESGNLGGKIGDINQKLSGLKSGFGDLGSALSSGLASTLATVGSLVAGIGGLSVAGVGAMAVIGAGTLGLNAHLEDTRIALAATFASFGATKDFNTGLGVASDQIVKMRKDAADLPGEFQDLVNIMQSAAPAALRGGMNVEDLRKLSARTMAVAAIDNIPQAVAARELAALIEGKAGSQNILGRKMLGLAGGEAKSFNAMPIEKRISTIQNELNKQAYTDAIGAMQKSYTALFTTLKSNVKTFAMDAGRPMFEGAKRGLDAINKWYESNPALIEQWATKLGNSIGNAFETGVQVVEHWGPLVEQFARNAASTIRNQFHSLQPLFERLGGTFEKFFSDPNAFQRLESMAKLLLAAKLGSGLLMPGASSAAGLASTALMGGAGAAEAGAALASMGIAAAALLPVAIAVAGAFDIMTDSSAIFHEQAQSTWSGMLLNMQNSASNLEPATRMAGDGLKTVADVMGMAVIQNIAAPFFLLDTALQGLYIQVDKFLKIAGLERSDIVGGRFREEKAAFKDKLLVNDQYVDTYDGKKKSSPPPPNHSTNIQKVEIVVNTNQDPQRIARLTVDELAKLMKNPKGSKRVPSFLASR